MHSQIEHYRDSIFPHLLINIHKEKQLILVKIMLYL